MSSFAYAKYKSTKVQTASPIDIIVQLYEGAIRFTVQAGSAIEAKDFSGKAVAIRKAHAIIAELRAILNHQHAPDLCQELERLYDYISRQLSAANLEMKKEHLDGALTVLRELCAGWSELAKRQKSGEIFVTPVAPAKPVAKTAP